MPHVSVTQESVTTLRPLLWWSHNKADVIQLNSKESGNAVFQPKGTCRYSRSHSLVGYFQPLRAD